MVKHTQTIRRQIADKLFECGWPFYGVGTYRVNWDVVSISYFKKYSRKCQVEIYYYAVSLKV